MDGFQKMIPKHDPSNFLFLSLFEFIWLFFEVVKKTHINLIKYYVP